MSDVIKSLAPGQSVNYRVSGLDANGAAAPIGTPAFTVESGTATLSAGADAFTQTITAQDANPAVIRVDANDAADGSGATLSTRVQLNGGGAPGNKAVSLQLTEV